MERLVGRRWLMALVGKCQVMVDPTALADRWDELRTIVRQLPDDLGPRERSLATGLIAEVVHRSQPARSTAPELFFWFEGVSAGVRLRTELLKAIAFVTGQGGKGPASANPRVIAALRLISQEYASPYISLSWVARRVDVSPAHLSRLITLKTGISFHTHLREVRLFEARLLLTGTLLSVKEIAAAVGYSNTAILDRNVRRRYGCSPGALRRQHVRP